MGGVRNGKSDAEPGATGAGQETLAANAHSPGAEGAVPGDVRGKVEGHLQVAARLLRERQAAKAFGELVRASRSLAMTRRLAAALVTVSLKAGTEAAAITLLTGAIEKLVGTARRDVQRQLARVLRRVEQLPRALEALESLLAAFPDDSRSRRVYQELLHRTGKWEALVNSLEHEAQEAFTRGEYARAARATRWRARVQAEQMRNLARAAESYGKAATYLEQMEDADGAFSMRLDGLRVLHSSGASEAVLTAAASVVMSAAARLGRDEQAREVMEELGLIPARPELPPEPPAAQEPPVVEAPKPEVAAVPEARAAPADPGASNPFSRPTRLDVPITPVVPQAGLSPGTRPTKPEFPAASPEAPGSDTHPTSLEMPAVTLENWVPEPRPLSTLLPAPQEAPAGDEHPTSLEMPAVTLEAQAPEPRPRPPPPPPPDEEDAPELSGAAPAGPASEASSAPPTVPAEVAAPPAAPAEALVAEADEEFASPDDVEEAEDFAPPEEEMEEDEPGAADSEPLTELFDIPDEDAERTAPPVALEGEEEAQAPRSEPPVPAAQEERDDPAAEQRLESQLIARKAWHELAQFYLARADRAKDPTLRAQALTQLAEVMENELNDPAGAARMYREIVSLTGDRAALKEQVRLLSQRGDSALVRRAVDEAVQSARTPKARADAYLTRAELELALGQSAQAKADFETAEALTPGLLLVRAGLVRCVSDEERPAAAQRMRSALAAAPRRAPDRLEALRVLASVAEDQLKDLPLALWAWTEVLAEEPGDGKARERLQALARVQGDKAGLSQALREQLVREPRGPNARKARLELVSTLEAAGDKEGALTELRQAVRFEPGHKEAWLLLADRLIARGQNGEAAWALEHAATATDDEVERQRTWARLATFCRDVLKDPARAETYARRAEKLRRILEDPSAPLVPEPSRNPVHRREVTGTRTQVLMPAPAAVDFTPSGQRFPPEEPKTDTHEPAPPAPPTLPDDARPTIEFSALNAFPGGKMPFSDEEPTATEAPEGFVPPSDEPAPPAKAKAEKTKATSARATSARATSARAASTKATGPQGPGIRVESKKQSVAEPPLDASRELDELLGEVSDDSSHTSPSLSIWSMRREPRADAPASGPEKPGARGQKAGTPAASSAAGARGQGTKGQRPAEPPVFEDTALGRKAAANPPPPPRAFPDARSKKGTAPAPAARPATSAESAFARVSPSEPEGQPSAYPNAPIQNTAMISWEAPPGKMEPVRKLARARGGADAAKAPVAEPPATEPAVFQQVRENPLDAGLYFQIAEYFDERRDAPRAALMREIADALEGREGPAPRPPRQPLSVDDRSGLRHPLLRTPPGELLSCVGVALCSLFPAYGRAAGTQEPIRPDMGVGAPAALEALVTTERLLGIHAPEVVLSEDNGPPFSLVFAGKPRVLVGKQAVRQVLPAAELRFYAGRALVCLEPDLLALRSLKKDQVLRGLAQLSSVLKAGPASSPESLVVYETLQPRQIERATALFASATRQFDVSALADAARDSANRAGLIACGAVGPALAALRLKRALEREVIELVRFAASERYFQLCGMR
jgi:tetratricopeptide (TPR) repeat protein